ncbi:MAG: hypothetical protein M3288_10310 [Thermoproteota archaeon]|nr:hypothetical protein [Thermoproteota archaeon]
MVYHSNQRGKRLDTSQLCCQKESPPFPPGTTTRAGGATRTPVPVRELNIIRRSISKAREQSPYLKEALRKPGFDIEKIYQS